jgi:hypothetical protein
VYGGAGIDTLGVMKAESTGRGERARRWFADQGVQVTDEGIERARRKLREMDGRMMPRIRVDAIFEPERPADE